MPNQAYRLNETATYLLLNTLKGKSIFRVLDEMIPRELQTSNVLSEVLLFFRAVRALVMGCLGEGWGCEAVEHIPFSRGGNLLPVLSEFAVTYRCNLACKFCYAGCACTKGKYEAEVPLDDVKTILRKIRFEAEVPSISFTGGEPCLREDLCEMTSYASSIGLRVNLITNGTLLTKKLVRRLRKAGLRSAQVSIEGPNAEIHDMLTGVAGSFECALRGIQFLKEEGIYVHTNTTINRLNMKYVDGIVDLAKSLGLPRFSMNMVMPCGSADPQEVGIRYVEVGEVVLHVKQRARQAGIEFLWYSPTPYCIFNPIASGLGNKACAACDGLLSVAPNGDVLPCSSLSDPVGNLLTQDFDSIWKSEKASYYRAQRHAPSKCQSCSYFEVCSGACPIYWNAFGCSEINVGNSRQDKIVGE
jgi:radical SAM protein with 4Fe4S-binding SPASM domain